MKTLDVYSLHPKVHDAESFVFHYRFSPLLKDFIFRWNSKNPSYLFVPELIYTSKSTFQKFFTFWQSGKNKLCVFIQYLEETIKPDLNLFDYAVCWDEEFILRDRVGRILPTQIWMSRFCPCDFIPVNSLDEARLIFKHKNKFCNFMYSHAEQNRDRLFHSIMKYKHVDSLGKRFHNTDSKPTGFQGHEQETSMLREPYKFTIAGENGEYWGYTSEKIWTSFWGHSIPIYWGNPNVEKDVNEKAFIHVRKFEDEEALIARIRQIDENEDFWCQMLCEPFQTSTQVLRDRKRVQQYYEFFEKIFTVPVENAKRIEWAAATEIYQNWFRHTTPCNLPLIERIKRRANLLLE